MRKELRSIEVGTGVSDIKHGSKGYFHSWCKEPYFWHETQFLTKTYALVELQDGRIKLVEPEAIRFLDPYDPLDLPN